MEYVKIKNSNQIERFPNPINVVISNPDDELKSKLAELFGWKELVESQPPTYDKTKQIATYHFEEHDNQIIQVWEVVDLPENDV